MRTSMLGIAACLVLACGTAWAGRPLAVDDAEPLDSGQVQVEVGEMYREDPNYTHFDFPIGLTYGSGFHVELGIGFGGQLEERVETGNALIRHRGLGDLTLAGKWQWFRAQGWLPAQALAPTVKFPTADHSTGMGSGEMDYDLTWIASSSFGEKTAIHVNLGHTWVGDPSNGDLGDIVHFGLAMDYQLLDALQWVGEVFAQEELREHEETWQYNTGFRWSVVDELTLDAAAGSRLSGAAPDFTATVGLTWVSGR